MEKVEAVHTEVVEIELCDGTRVDVTESEYPVTMWQIMRRSHKSHVTYPESPMFTSVKKAGRYLWMLLTFDPDPRFVYHVNGYADVEGEVVCVSSQSEQSFEGESP